VNAAVDVFMRLYLKIPNMSVKDQFRKVIGIKTRYRQSFPFEIGEKKLCFASENIFYNQDERFARNDFQTLIIFDVLYRIYLGNFFKSKSPAKIFSKYCSRVKIFFY